MKRSDELPRAIEFLPPGVDGARVAQRSGSSVSMSSPSHRQHVQHSPDAEGNSIIGVGCYPRAAILNHSCQPNCVLAYVGSGATLHARTTREIAQALCHSYAELCADACGDTAQPLWFRLRLRTLHGAGVSRHQFPYGGGARR